MKKVNELKVEGLVARTEDDDMIEIDIEGLGFIEVYRNLSAKETVISIYAEKKGKRKTIIKPYDHIFIEDMTLKKLAK